jgi:NAD(P)-dependent dehydrogenase (short-subunit alcohol dehydrogenase family)
VKVLITGSKSGIGQATALRLARQGHDVFTAVRQPSSALELCSRAGKEGLSLRMVEIDVTDETSVLLGIQQVIDEAGQIDVLINNAGVAGMGAIEESSDDVARRLMETNFLGPLRMIRAVLPPMRSRGSGVIVNVSSLLGRLVISPLGLYAASKYALEAMSEALAQEVRSYGIRVAIVEPGPVITPMLRHHNFTAADESPYADQYRRAGAVLRRMASLRISPEDVAAVIETAILTDQPKLRYVVNDDVNDLLQRRLDMSDEQWLGPNRRLTDDEWFLLAAAAMGLDFRPTAQRKAA